MTDYGSKFKYGGVVYPITSSTTNTLLQDADPSLYYTIHFAASVITTYVQPRLLNEVARLPKIAAITKAVSMLLPWDPVPYLSEAQVQFPLLAIYRKTEKNVWKVQSYMDDVAEWGIQYVLPPITAGQTERVMPILRSVSRVLMNRFENKMDDGYLGGADVWATAQLEEIYIDRGQYGAYEGTKSNMLFPAWSGTLIVKERDMPLGAAQFQSFGGIDNELDVVPSDGSATLTDVVDSQVTLDGSQPAGLAFYANSPASISITNGVVTNWNGMTNTGSPLLVTDSVTGKPAMRFDVGASLALPAGHASALSNGSSTVFLVWRQRTNADAQSSMILVDSSGNGAAAGYQLLASDNYSLAHYREIRARVYDGANWIVDRSTSASPYRSYAPLKWNITATTVTPTRATVNVDGSPAYDDTIAAVFSSSAGGSLTVGGCQIDVQALVIYSPALTDTVRDATRLTLAAQYGVDEVTVVSGDGLVNYSTPSGCLMPNGQILAIYRNGSDQFSTDGTVDTRTSPDGGMTWSVPTTIRPSLSPTRGWRSPTVSLPLADTSLIASWYNDDNVTLEMATSTDNGVTWNTGTRVTKGNDLLEASAAPIVQKGSTLFWPVYVKKTGDSFISARVWTSTDGGITWPNDYLIASGNSAGKDLTEPGILVIKVATQGLNVGDMLALIRDDASSTMRESISTNSGVTWSALAATGIDAHSAGRLMQFTDGKIVFLGRSSTLPNSTIYQRTATGSVWNTSLTSPVAPGIDARDGTMFPGAMFETSAGVAGILFATQLSTTVSYVQYRTWPEWQLNGHMPNSLSPLNPIVTAGSQTQFTALGPGNVVWAITTNNTNGSIDQNGLYTAGVFNGVDTITTTDVNGFVLTTNVTVAASTWTVWGLASCKLWVDSSASTITTSGGNLVSWSDKSPAGNNVVPGNATVVPVTTSDSNFNSKKSLTLGASGSFLKSNSNIVLGPFTQFICVKTAAIGYLAVHNSDAANGDFWYTGNPSVSVTRSGVSQNGTFTAFAANITANTAKVARVKFDGVSRANTRLAIDNVDQGGGTFSPANDLDTTTVTGPIYIGGNATGGGNLAATVTAFGVFDGTLSAADDSNIRFYLKKLYGTA